MPSKKFVALLNKKIEPGRILNALAHMTLGLAGTPGIDLGILNYADKDGGAHVASKYPFIILKADNSNKIRTLRHALVERKIPFASFTSAMTVDNYEEQVERMKSTPEADLEYFGVCMYGEKEDVDELTRKFSLWN